MPRINQKEYEVLKGMGSGWKWLARKSNGNLYKHSEKPTKLPTRLDETPTWLKMDGSKFLFIKSTDEPYSITKLIEEYEYYNKTFGILEVTEAQFDKRLEEVIEEIEETEVKSKRELIEKWESAIEAAEFYGKGKEERLISYMKDFVDDLNQLDEPEVLSQEWIDNHTDKFVSSFDLRFVSTKDLKELLVPNQEKVKIESVWAEDIEDAKASGMTLFKAMNWMAIDSDEKEKQDLFARAWLDGYTVEEQKYYAKVKGWGANGNDGHAYYSGKFPLSLTMATESVAHIKDEWKNYGVYEDNADFVLVEELEE